MKLLNGSVVFLCSLLAVTPVAAQDQPAAIPYKGAPGVWFPRDTADKLLDVVERKLPAAQDVIAAQDKLLDLQLKQIATATTTTQQALDLAAQQEEFATTVQQAYEEEVNRNSGLFQQPVFWFAVGVLLTGGTAAAVAIGVSQ